MKYLTLAAALSLSAPAYAQQIYSDDFNAEANGGTAIFQTTLSNWDIDGYVDVIGTDNTLGYSVSSTMIDLGGGLTGGFMKSKEKFSYDAGQVVTISWDMSGNQIRPRGEDVPYIQFYFDQRNEESYQEIQYIRGTGFFNFIDYEAGEFPGPIRIYDYYFAYGYGLYGDYPLTRQSISFLPVAAGAFKFELGTYSGGGYGPLIDNFAVSLGVPGAGGVPEPATWAMLITGFGAVGGLLRRRRARVAVAYA